MNERAIAVNSSNRAALWLVVLWILTSMLWWGLAFWPVSSTTPEWFVRTQYACFGSRPSGLPDTFGWLLLFAGPALLLVGVIVSHGTDVIEDIKTCWRAQFSRSLLIGLFSLFALESGWVVTRIIEGYRLENISYAPAAAGALPDNYPRLSQPASNFDLVDQAGNKMSLESFKGRPVILSFAFAHCETVCPVLVTTAMAAKKQLEPKSVAVALITLDPWRDTPGALRNLALNWGLEKDAHIMSGSVEEVLRTLDAYKVSYQRDEKTGDVTHAALLYVLDTNGQIAYAFNNPTVEWVVDAIKRVLE